LGWLSDPETAPSLRVGYITTRRIGNAVVRNRVRRRLRGILQRTGDRLKDGYCLVLVARNPSAEATSVALEKEWKWLAHRAGIFRDRPGPEDRNPAEVGPGR
jgi:ribonuclease P protein component